MNFFSKLRAATLGAAHDLMDKAIDMNSPSTLRQYVRDLESAIGKLTSESVVQLGQVRTLTREKEGLESKVESETEAVTKILKTDPESSRSKAAIIVQDKKHLAQIEIDLPAHQKVADDLLKAVASLQIKHDLAVARVQELERIDRDSKAKESAASALQSVDSLLGGVSTHSVDNLEDKMLRRNDLANAKFDQAMSSVHVEETNKEDVDRFLASLAEKPKKAPRS